MFDKIIICANNVWILDNFYFFILTFCVRAIIYTALYLLPISFRPSLSLSLFSYFLVPLTRLFISLLFVIKIGLSFRCTNTRTDIPDLVQPFHCAHRRRATFPQWIRYVFAKKQDYRISIFLTLSVCNVVVAYKSSLRSIYTAKWSLIQVAKMASYQLCGSVLVICCSVRCCFNREPNVFPVFLPLSLSSSPLFFSCGRPFAYSIRSSEPINSNNPIFRK